MWQVLLITIVLMGAVFALFSIKIILQKNGKFPQIHIGGNKALNKKGIYCANTQDKLERKEAMRIRKKNMDNEFTSGLKVTKDKK